MSLLPSFFLVSVMKAPLPLPFVEALESVEVECSTDAASILRLRFSLSRNGFGDWDLQTFDLFRPMLPVSIRLAAGSIVPETLVNGFVRETRLHNAERPGRSTLEVVALDATATVMNHIEQPFPYPNQPDSVIAMQLFSRYAMIASPLTVWPTLPTRTILDIQTTVRSPDIRYLRRAARLQGYELYVQPEPLSGIDVGHFHPPFLSLPPQGVLSVDFGAATNLAEFQVAYDALRPTMALGIALDPRTKAPIPAVAPLSTDFPMALEPATLRVLPPAITRPTMRDAANPAEAIAQARSLANRSARAIKGSGTVDGLKFGRILRPGLPVAVRGAGMQHSGNYYVTKVSHRIERSRWEQRFEAWRNGVGLTGAELFIDPLATAG
ncbi:Phage late control gene D protein (GPD) [Caballeronia peredens]|nr:Phage late control gene D protein (GPD) [Caballeronia peredens]